MFIVVGVDASVWSGDAAAGAHLLLADEAPVHAAGGVVPAPNRHALNHLCFHDVAAVLVDVVVGLTFLPETTGRQRERRCPVNTEVQLHAKMCFEPHVSQKTRRN